MADSTVSNLTDGAPAADTDLFYVERSGGLNRKLSWSSLKSAFSKAGPTGGGYYNVKDYGATGDGTTDDRAAIQAAYDALKANTKASTGSFGGQTLYFPAGKYKISSALDFSKAEAVRFLGDSGRNGPSGNAIPAPTTSDTSPTVITIGVASGFGVNLAESQGIVWDGIDIAATGTFIGRLMNFDADRTKPPFGNRIQNCRLTAYGTTGVRMVSMNNCIEYSFDNVVFGECPGGTQVRMTNLDSGNGGHGGSFSNANSFRSCSFIEDRDVSVLDPGSQTTFLDCTFEGTESHVVAPVKVTSAGGWPAFGVAFTGCGFWDVTNGTAAWIQATAETAAWAFSGCYFESSSGSVFSMDEHTGLALSGCYFRGTYGTPTVFDPAYDIANGSMLGCAVNGVTDNHASVFV